MSIHLLLRPSRPSSRSMMRVSAIISSVSAIAEMASRTSKTRDHQEKGMTGRSTPWNEEIRRTAKDTGTAENNSHVRRKRDPSDAPMARKSGVRSIVPMDMIWKSAKLF
jgi:hypothetical protein